MEVMPVPQPGTVIVHALFSRSLFSLQDDQRSFIRRDGKRCNEHYVC